MTAKAIQGKLLALTKEYYLRSAPADAALTQQFIVSRSNSNPFSGFGMTWWVTRRGLAIRDDLARLVASEIPNLRMDIEVLSESIGEVFQNNAGNTALFGEIFFSQQATLFAARAVDEREFSARLWKVLHDSLISSICTWLVVVPLRRLISGPVDVGADGIFVVPRDDESFWQSVSAEFPAARDWSPTTGRSDDRDIQIHGSKLPESWLACKVTGDQSRGLIDAKQRMQTFVALLYAQLLDSIPGLLVQSMADMPHLCHQFSADRRRSFGRISSSIGEILPSLMQDITLKEDTVAKMRAWYTARDATDPSESRRAVIASQFVQHGLVADDLERFIYFFIALDGLFGVRGNVEESIVGRVEQLHGIDWSARARRLFDLRNEIVHGGSSRIEDWREYDDYVRHFTSKPMDDAATVALKSLGRYWETDGLTPLPSRRGHGPPVRRFVRWLRGNRITGGA